MKINIISDLHGFFDFENQKSKFLTQFDPQKLTDADVLVIAGDIGSLKTDCIALLKDFKQKLIPKKFKKIIYCNGNHDFYEQDLKNNYKSCPLNQVPIGKIYNFKNIIFIVTTLWTPIYDFPNEIYYSLNDYNYIKFFNINISNYLFEKSVDFIINSLEKNKEKKCVIVTHHVPSKELIEKKYLNIHNSQFKLNEAFTVMHYSRKYGNFIEKITKNYNVPLWIHGHAHSFCDKKINNTRFVRNPIGYCFQKNNKIINECNFKYNFIIDI